MDGLKLINCENVGFVEGRDATMPMQHYMMVPMNV
jgi:hypothetical protein